MTTNYKFIRQNFVQTKLSRTRTTNYKRGAAVMTVVFFFVFVTITISIGMTGPVVREYKNARDFENSKETAYLAEAGIEDVLYRIKSGKQYDAEEVLVLNGNTVTTTVTDISIVSPVQKRVSAVANISGIVRKTSLTITTSAGVSFTVGVQVGNGGLQLDNNSTVTGNVYSAGNIVGQSKNKISGSVVSAGSTGSVTGIITTTGSSIYANTINDSIVGGDAYYKTISNNSTVVGTRYPGSADQEPVPMPITEEMIYEWQADAASGVGPFTDPPDPCIISVDTTWSTRKITCTELRIEKTLTLKGMLWVVGDVTIKGGTVILDETLEAQSAGIIAHNPAATSTSGKIKLETSANFLGSGDVGSYVMLLSRNNSEKLGGPEIAISLQQSATGAIFLYSNEGRVVLEQSADVKEVTAYKVHLKNSANVTYESGLTSIVFVGVPEGGWVVNDWKPIP